jgi:2-C-methyl-D-erythritol 4-phosphate cytidylyltransferase/2-C-methyl-D-erythritol 2,4-cyclodiphosphate synthase
MAQSGHTRSGQTRSGRTRSGETRSGETWALLVAAGAGSRAGKGGPKQYRPLAGRPLLAHALDGLRHPGIDAVQVVIGHDQIDDYARAAGSRPLPPPLIGGATRRDSVRIGLEALARHGGVGRVLVHDAARPFLPASVIDRLLDALDDASAAVPVLPVVDTIARQDGRLGENVSRDTLVRVQTPQAFNLDALLRAHRAWTGGEATDDAQIVRAAGIDVALVAGDPCLEKITFDEDFRRAEAALAASRVPRIGMGFDVHAFGPGDGIWLGGIRIDHDRGLVGHSDADVLLHAVTDALLGALGAGDIGEHFPPSEARWRGAASSVFIEHARGLAEAARAEIGHVDATVICEAPKVGPHREAIRERIAALLRLPVASVSVKATTTERLGFTGRGEGIAAQAVLTLLVERQS